MKKLNDLFKKILKKKPWKNKIIIDLNEFAIIKKVFRRSNKFLLCFFIFKLFLLFFYLMSGYQDFTTQSTIVILRIIMSNDIIILFFSVLNIITNINIQRKYSISISIVTLSVFNIFFSLFTLFLTFIVIVLY